MTGILKKQRFTIFFICIATLFLTAALLFVSVGYADTAYADTTAHDHGTWTELNKAKVTEYGNKLLDGNYYLVEDLSGSISVEGTVKLCLNGHNISGGSSVITVDSENELTLCDCIGGGCIKDGDVTARGAYGGGGVKVSGKFTLESGKICNNIAVDDKTQLSRPGTRHGGGVLVAGGEFIMNGGEISQNKSYNGGGVYVESGTFTMNGGVIRSNNAKDGGGDKNGGGVYVDNNPRTSFTMTGGTITENLAETYGGGVYVRGGNTNDLAMQPGGVIYVGGNPSILGNQTNNEPDNVCTKTITLIGKLTQGTKIGVNRRIDNDGTDSAVGEFTENYYHYNRTAYPSNYFVSDKGYCVKLSGAEAAFEGQHIWENDICTDCGQGAVSSVKIGENGAVIFFKDFEGENGAASYATANGTSETNTAFVTLLANMELTETFHITAGKYVSLDLNGFSMSPGSGNKIHSIITVQGNFTLTDDSGYGIITGNTGSSQGAGVYVNGGAFKMTGGQISGNSASGGGGVSVINNSTFEMTGGAIKNNVASYGGGVRVDTNSTFKMSGGIISGNTTTYYGGGVRVLYNSAFEMTGGTISGNSTEKYGGGGVRVESYCTFKMTGGSIINNTTAGTGGGVNIGGGNVLMSGTPIITDNTDNNGVNNLLLQNDVKIEISAELQDGAKIGVAGSGTIATDFTQATGKPSDFFIPDNADYCVRLNESDLSVVIETSHEYGEGGKCVHCSDESTSLYWG